MRQRRILFVAMHDSVHVARWVDQVADAGWDLHLFPIGPGLLSPALRGVTIHWPLSPISPNLAVQAAGPADSVSLSRVSRFARAVKLAVGDPGWLLRRMLHGPLATSYQRARGDSGPSEIPNITVDAFQPTLHDYGGFDSSDRIRLGESEIEATAPFGPSVLASVIRRVQPDLIHSMEFQHAGYLVLKAREMLGADFPKWMASNWGSDIFYYRRFPDHASQIRRLMQAIDLYSCECERDFDLGEEFGFVGPRLPLLTNTGGFDIDELQRLRSPLPPSKRKAIMVKGYQHFAGRAMTSLQVLERFAPHLKDYEIVLYSASPEPRKLAVQLHEAGVLNIRIVDWAPHNEMLSEFGRARIYLGVSISDAISTSVLESMAMGAFPIQTNTSCCNEWFKNGESGFIVEPENFEQISASFFRALTDDALVDRAAPINYEVIASRLDVRDVRVRMKDFYNAALA